MKVKGSEPQPVVKRSQQRKISFSETCKTARASTGDHQGTRDYTVVIGENMFLSAPSLLVFPPGAAELKKILKEMTVLLMLCAHTTQILVSGYFRVKCSRARVIDLQKSAPHCADNSLKTPFWPWNVLKKCSPLSFLTDGGASLHQWRCCERTR